MIAELGLALIILGWAFQLKKVWSSKKKELELNFVAVYSLGVALLVYDGYVAGLTTMAALNFVSFVVAALVFWKIR